MNNLIVLAISASIVYFFTRFIEMRFIKGESEPLKGLFKDSMFVFISTALGGFIATQISGNLLSGKVSNTINSENTPAFTGNPDF